MKIRSLASLCVCGLMAVFTSCSGVKAPARWNYAFEYGKTAVVRPDGKAIAPPKAPSVVHKAVAAANEIAGAPYKWGGGHAKMLDNGYDCSGATSYVLNRCGLMRGSATSSGFLRYGESGEGDWITLYTKDGHTFLVIAGLRFDTGGAGNKDTGPQWKTASRKTSGFYLRRPPGL